MATTPASTFEVPYCSWEACTQAPALLVPYLTEDDDEVRYVAWCSDHVPHLCYLLVLADHWPFRKGEILTLGHWDRDIDSGRKPSKWDVETQEFPTLEAAREGAKKMAKGRQRA